MNKINAGKVKTNLPISNYNLDNEKPQILFKYFNGNSIRINDFNNYYENQKTSIGSVYSFITRIKDIQSKTLKELRDRRTAELYHFHPIEGEIEIERINYVLKEGYDFSDNTIENFENNYYEFALDSGERVIFLMVDNLFELLFIDNNHFIYRESSRRAKYKDKFECPSCLGKINFLQSYEELETIDIIKMLIDSYENGEINDLDEFVSMLKDLIKYDKELVIN